MNPVWCPLRMPREGFGDRPGRGRHRHGVGCRLADVGQRLGDSGVGLLDRPREVLGRLRLGHRDVGQPHTKRSLEAHE